jgi:hypothetical protein
MVSPVQSSQVEVGRCFVWNEQNFSVDSLVYLCLAWAEIAHSTTMEGQICHDDKNYSPPGRPVPT